MSRRFPFLAPGPTLAVATLVALLSGFASAARAQDAVTTPTEIAGAESHIYRAGDPEPMRLFVVKPKGWSADQKRSALIHFFGGGWERGTPEKSVGWAQMAANLGMVGIAPDYRTKERFGTTPLECVADGRAALRWVQEHAAELGIDPARIVVSGNSAGGHVALWTAIEQAPPGSDPAESPLAKPAALILVSAASDTNLDVAVVKKRFADFAKPLSPLHNLDPKMPPVLMFHGDADATVPYSCAVALDAALKAGGNTCEFVTVPGGGHGFRSELPEWKDKSKEMIVSFLNEQKLLPALAE